MKTETREFLRNASDTLEAYARFAKQTAKDWDGMSAARKDRRTKELHRNFAAVCWALAQAARRLAKPVDPPPSPEPVYDQETTVATQEEPLEPESVSG